MSLYPFELEVNLIQLAVMIVLGTWNILKNKKRMDTSHKLFLWGIVAYIFMNLYWIAMIVVDGGGTYKIFTACDTAFIAMFLIWTSMYEVKRRLDYKASTGKKALYFSALWSLWNTIWWILWSGKYTINILWGIVLFLLFYEVFYSVESSKTMSKKYMTILGILIGCLVVFEVPMYLIGSGNIIYNICDWICAISWLVICCLFLYLAFKNKSGRTNYLMAGFLFAELAQDLTDGIKYTLALCMVTLFLSLLLLYYRTDELWEVAE